MTTNYIVSRFVMTPKKGYKKSDKGIPYLNPQKLFMKRQIF